MATKLQKRFSKCKLLRRAMFNSLLFEGLSFTGNKRFFNELIKDIAEPMPEPQIKLLLYEFLQCEDITEKERSEAIALLQLSQTTLTREQQEIFYNMLYE